MVYLAIASVIWAFSFGLIKHFLIDLDPSFVAFVRMALALAVLLPFVRPRRFTRGLSLRFAAIGALQLGVMYVTYIRSYQYLMAYEVALLTIFAPLWITFLNGIFTRRLNVRFYLAALLALAGAAVIVSRGEGLGLALTGALLVQIANLAFGAGQLAYKRTLAAHPEVRSRDAFGLVCAGAVVVTLVATAFTFDPGELKKITGEQVLVLVYLGSVAAGLGFLMWNHGATRVNVGVLTAFNNVTIALAVPVSILVFGEDPDLLRLAIGAPLMLVAVFLNRGGDPGRA